MNTQRLLLDGTITTLPSNIIENILRRLPTDEIVRTSILSKKWRYKWTKIPKVAFTMYMFHDSMLDESTGENQLPDEQGFEEPPSERKMMSRRCKFFYAIYQFLLLHQGPIVDFTLDMWTMNTSRIDCVEIDQILLHLSRKNTVTKLRLSSCGDLPLSIFSFHQLTHLYLSHCCLNHPLSFNGFGSLTNLRLEWIGYILRKTLTHIFANNPLLKSFTMITDGGIILISDDDEYGTIDELFQLLPVIEDLTLTVHEIESLGRGVLPRKLATSLLHLKYLHLDGMSLVENVWLRFLVLMMRSSPNLEKITLEMMWDDDEESWMDVDHDMEFDDFLYCLTMKDCSDIWLENLIEFKFQDNVKTKHELEFVKLILAKSPVLKKLIIWVYYKHVNLKLLEALSSPPPASPMVEILGYGDGKGLVLLRRLNR